MKTGMKNLLVKKDLLQQQKMPYITPHVTVYGTIAEITKAGGGSGRDLLFGTPVDPAGINI